ncbi:MAG TPA: pyrroloquinoline quinone biosynthesis protein PqqE [Steroidobacteraceae bacterium]|nr:pyrroloquinoline quinone biosynthesis protein PqqE [Steroidobacteraceae bacterium]
MTPRPQALIAEVTHRCPLHCVYCSNPLEMRPRGDEISGEAWGRIFREAAELGVLHLHLTGGEPCARQDLEELLAAGRAAKLYTNLITSGIGLSQPRLDALIEAGLDHLQLSFQDAEEAPANEYAGARAHARKLALAEVVRGRGVAFTLNAVVHRENLARLESIIAMAERLGVDRLEIANVQYYGWALENRERLMPTRRQMTETVALVQAHQQRLKGRMRIDFVPPDYYARYPKACMGGWGRALMVIDPAGRVLPCHAADVIPELTFENAVTRPLRWIWEESAAFRRFRGEDWMPEPCRGCDRRHEDFGGCRCQAFLVAGNAAATDPVCSLAPGRNLVDRAIERANSAGVREPGWVYRIDAV